MSRLELLNFSILYQCSFTFGSAKRLLDMCVPCSFAVLCPHFFFACLSFIDHGCALLTRVSAIVQLHHDHRRCQGGSRFTSCYAFFVRFLSCAGGVVHSPWARFLAMLAPWCRFRRVLFPLRDRSSQQQLPMYLLHIASAAASAGDSILYQRRVLRLGP